MTIMYKFFCHLPYTVSERISCVNVKNRKFNNNLLRFLSTLRIPPYYDTHGGIPMFQQGHSQSLTMHTEWCGRQSVAHQSRRRGSDCGEGAGCLAASKAISHSQSWAIQGVPASRRELNNYKLSKKCQTPQRRALNANIPASL